MRILLAEDDTRLGPLIVHMLKKQCHSTDWVRNGNEALDYAFHGKYELIIMDWMLPGLSGVGACLELRKNGFGGGILMLTARDALSDRVEGLDSGADDYLVKPFEFEELFARIRSLSRRFHLPVSEERTRYGPYVLDWNGHSLFHGGRRIPLTIREYQLLEVLMRNLGRVIPRNTLLERIWGTDVDITNNSLDALVRLLRRKLEPEQPALIIRNIRGVGYTLEMEDSSSNRRTLTKKS